MATVLLLASVAVATGGSPLAAQSNVSVIGPPAPTNDIGPGELSNFTLNGTVTRPAERPPAARPVPPVARPEVAAPAPSTTRPAPAPPPVVASPPTANRSNPADSDLFRRPPTLPDASSSNAVTAAPAIPEGDRAPSPSLADEGFSLLPWLVGLLAAAGAGLIFFGRHRRQQREAAASEASFESVRPDPVPEPDPVSAPTTAGATAATPAPTGVTRRPLPTTLMPPAAVPKQAGPAPTQAQAGPMIPGGIVSTSLRPWIEIELSPDRALLDEQGAAIAFELTLFNSGSAAARDVTIEARLLNAGAGQDAELSEFFTAFGASGDPIPQIAPYSRVPLRSAVRLPHAAIQGYDVDGRKLFVPMVAISIRYRWSSSTGQSAAGFLVGQGADGQAKLAPLRLDRGFRSWTGLGARRYEKGLRS